MKIAILDDYANAARNMAQWDTLNADITVFNDTITDRDALISRLSPFDVLCLMRERTPFPASLINSLPNLKLIVTSGPRNLSIDLSAAAARDITVCGTESRKTSTSELALLLLLALSRKLIPEVNAMQQQGWQRSLGRDLHGQTLGLIGLGKIGIQMAALGKALGMNVCAWSENLTPDRCESVAVSHCSSLNELMASSDAVSVHLLLSERTTGLVDAAAFAAMRENAIFINTSRGPIADQTALLEGLRQQRPFMAGVDVYDEEPLPNDHPLRDEDLIAQGRLLLTPHLGYVTTQAWQLFYQQTVDAIAAWRSGTPIRVLS